MEIRKDMYRQFVTEDPDDGEVIWLRLPDDVRRALLKLLGGMSLDALEDRGIPREAALKLSDLRQSLF
jgi:hypothetical protein